MTNFCHIFFFVLAEGSISVPVSLPSNLIICKMALSLLLNFTSVSIFQAFKD